MKRNVMINLRTLLKKLWQEKAKNFTCLRETEENNLSVRMNIDEVTDISDIG